MTTLKEAVAAEKQQTEKDMETIARAKFVELGMADEATDPNLVSAVVSEATRFTDETFDLPTQEIAVATSIAKFLYDDGPRYAELREKLERQIGRLVIDHMVF
jgi:hypothetical protein